MNIDGRSIAADILEQVRSSIEGKEVVVRAVTMRPSPATESYLRIKTKKASEAGMHMEVVQVADDASTEEVIEAVQAPGAHAVIVQLPLAEHVDMQAVLDAIPVSQDADVLSTTAYARFEVGEPEALLPPVAAAVAEILARADIDPVGKSIVVVGNGRLVGQPVAAWLRRFTDTGVKVLTRESTDLEASVAQADIIITGAGVPNLIQPHMIKEGVVIIDAGTSESGGQVVGDADPACAEKASVFTPVPGGVGPVAVACLFRNTSILISQELQGS